MRTERILARDLQPGMRVVLDNGDRVKVIDCYPVPGRARGLLMWLELSNGAAGAVEDTEVFQKVHSLFHR